MKKYILSLFAIITTFLSTTNAQTIGDLFQKSETPIYWLGIDFSNVKLIGDFNQFAEWGKVTTREIRNDYFPAWNDLVYMESSKYDVADIFRKEKIVFHTDPIYHLNKMAAIESMETRTEPNYTKEQLQEFVAKYNFQKEGLGIVLMAETLNKFKAHAKYHLLVINLKTNEILLHQPMVQEAGGIGVKNYWAKTIANAFKQIKEQYYFEWKDKYKE